MYSVGENYQKHVRNWFFVRVYKVGSKFFTGSVNEIKIYRAVYSRKFLKSVADHEKKSGI